MHNIAEKLKKKTCDVKKRAVDFYICHKYVSGITVIELVLILVIIIALLLIFQKSAD